KSPHPLGNMGGSPRGGRMPPPNGNPPSLFQGDQRTKKWNAPNKILCPIDRIDNPPGVLASWRAARLFSQNAVTGEVLPQRLQNDLFASSVCSRYRTLVSFRFNLEGRA